MVLKDACSTERGVMVLSRLTEGGMLVGVFVAFASVVVATPLRRFWCERGTRRSALPCAASRAGPIASALLQLARHGGSSSPAGPRPPRNNNDHDGDGDGAPELFHTHLHRLGARPRSAGASCRRRRRRHRAPGWAPRRGGVGAPHERGPPRRDRPSAGGPRDTGRRAQ